MKKFNLALLLGLFIVIPAYARDYTKLQVREAQHSQKYENTGKYFSEQAKYSDFTSGSLRDPHLFLTPNFMPVDELKYENKIKQDNKQYEEYAKVFGIKSLESYLAQAKGSNYYKLYRVAEKIIRANNLAYINWRIGVYRNPEDVNAFNSSTNFIAISTSLYDTFCDNEDALAFIVGHEMGHALLGHAQRKIETQEKIDWAKKHKSGLITNATYAVQKRKYLIDSKNMEFAADVEGAKLALTAGYDLNKAIDVLSFFNTLGQVNNYFSDHPKSSDRIDNFQQNRKYFIEDEWRQIGKYNIYNSDVLKVERSSDRQTIVIHAQSDNRQHDSYYKPEKMDELYARFGYKSYLNSEFEKSLEYFEKMFKINQNNSSAYLYASYAAEELYKQNKDDKYLNLAKNYASIAYKLNKDNKDIKQQFESL